jgi:hypothetical protein
MEADNWYERRQKELAQAREEKEKTKVAQQAVKKWENDKRICHNEGKWWIGFFLLLAAVLVGLLIYHS